MSASIKKIRIVLFAIFIAALFGLVGALMLTPETTTYAAEGKQSTDLYWGIKNDGTYDDGADKVVLILSPNSVSSDGDRLTKYNKSSIFSPWSSNETITEVTVESEAYAPPSMYQWFMNQTSLRKADLSNLNTSEVTKMGSAFSGCSGLTELDVSNFNTASVTDMRTMFKDCSGLTELDVSGFSTASATDMCWMFDGCSGLTNLTLFSLYNPVSDVAISGMFKDCSGLTSLDLSDINTTNTKSMYQLFRGCSSLTSLDLSLFDTSSVTGMGEMFYGCNGLTSLDLSSFDASSVTSMSSMFRNCTGIKVISVSDSLAQTLHDTTANTYLFSTPHATWYAEDGNAYTDTDRFSQGGTYFSAPYEVTVGTEKFYYDTVTDAWDKAKEVSNATTPATVKMFADAVTTDTITVESTNNITLDLNGRMLKYDNSAANDPVLTVNGTLTLKDSPNSVTHNYDINDDGLFVFKADGAYTLDGGVIAGGTGLVDHNLERRGGGVYVSGTFTMSGGSICGNTAKYGSGVYVSSGSFSMTNGKITGNKADYYGSVYVRGTFTMSDTAEISKNKAAAGGGVWVTQYGEFDMDGGTISKNVAKNNGGGVYVDQQGSFAMTDGEIIGNTAGSGGGGVTLWGTFVMTGGTIGGGESNANTATTHGGGIYVGSDSTLNVSGAVTIGGNKGGEAADNVYLNKRKTITVTGALTDPDNSMKKAQIGVTLASDYSGAFTSGYGDNNKGASVDNIIAPVTYFSDDKADTGVALNGDEAAIGKTVAQVEVNGATKTYVFINDAFTYANSVTTAENAPAEIKLLANTENSSALNVSAGNYITLDLNGYMLRYDNALHRSDSVIYIEGGIFTLKDTNTDTADTDKIHNITDPSDPNKTIEIVGGLITGGAGGGVGVYNSYNYDDELISAGKFEMLGGTIAGNDSFYGGGGVHVDGDSEFTMTGGTITANTANFRGAGVVVWGSFTMTGGTITGNNVENNGGGVCVPSNGIFEMKGGSICGNTANYGGGVYVEERFFSTDRDGTFTMTGGSICGNTSNYCGGVGIYGGIFKMTGGAISCNTAEDYGGGVYVESAQNNGEVTAVGKFEMSGGIIGGEGDDKNTANNGGGVCVAGGEFKLSGGKITGNTATRNGGGVYIVPAYYAGEEISFGKFEMTDGEISGNTAAYAAGGVFVYDGCTFVMSGGSICGNTADCGGGVALIDIYHDDTHADAMFILSGGKIIGNAIDSDGGEKTNNVELDEGLKITVSEKLKDGTLVGIALPYGVESCVFTSGYGENNKVGNDVIKPSAYFVSDDGSCVKLNGGEAVVGAFEHNYGDFVIDKPATCTENGSKSRYCADCGYQTDVTVINALGHDYGDFVVDKEATCTEEGSKSKHCSRCDETTEVTVIPMIPHTLTHFPETPATAETEGNIEYWECEVCGKIFLGEDGTDETTDRASIIIPKLTDTDNGNDNSALWITLIVILCVVIAAETAVIIYRIKRKNKTKEKNG